MDKFDVSIKNLTEALSLKESTDLTEDLKFLMIVKAFEVCLEYTWKALKYRVEEEGLEARSPKEAIRQAAKIDLLSDPETLMQCLAARNASVHDYFGIPRAAYLSLAESLLRIIEQDEVFETSRDKA
jgi:uncharacterized protein YutE (UPF0331/DUF86 family)